MKKMNAFLRTLATTCAAIFILSASVFGQRVQRPVIEKPTKEPLIIKEKAAPPVSTKPVATNLTDKPKPVRNMQEFKKTPAFSVRQASYSSNFTNPSKSFKMDDGSTLKINLKRSEDGGQADNISARQTSSATTQKDNDWQCVTTNMIVDARSINFGVSDYQKQAAHIYPGAIYTFENLMNGSFRQQPGTRNPIIVSTDNKNMSGDTYVEVTNPSAATIQSGVAALYRRFSGPAANGSTVMQLYESYNTADWTLKLNAGGSAWGVSINNSFKSSEKSQHRYLTIDVKKTLFTINTLPPDKGFFVNASDETAAPNMMFISSVAYGIRILANLEVTFKSTEAANEFNAKYKSGFYNANVDLSYLQNNSSIETQINAYIVGGPNEGIITFDRDQLITTLNKILSGATYQNAQAISYSLSDMAGNTIGAQSATDQFAYRNCVPAKNAPELVSAHVNVQCGKDGKDRDTHYSYFLFSSRKVKAAAPTTSSSANSSPVSSMLTKMLNSLPREYEIAAALYTNNSDNSRFENNSSNNINKLELNSKSAAHTLDDFYKEGRLLIQVEPNGHDEWQIANLNLTLNFSDGSSKQVRWSNIVLSHQNKTKNLYFKAGGEGALQAFN